MNDRIGLRSGFTIVELLVAVFVLGILLAAIVSLSSSYLGFSRRVSTINERLADLSDALGYVGTNARSAMDVVGFGGTTVDVTLGGDTFACDVLAADPCIALVVPVVDRATTTSAIVGFELLAYRFVALSDWADNPGLVGGWDGTDTPTLLEYRAPLCSGCATPPAVPADVTATRVSLVATNLTFDDGVGGAFDPFGVADGTSSITVRLRERGSGAELDTFVPGDGPMVLTVLRRP